MTQAGNDGGSATVLASTVNSTTQIVLMDPPNFEFDIVGQADNVNGLDALEAAHQVYGGELGMVYDMNVQVVQGPH